MLEQAQKQLFSLIAAAYAQTEASFGQFGAQVAYLIIGIAAYAIIVGSLYGFLSKKEMFSIKPGKFFSGKKPLKRFLGKLFLLFSYTFFFPLAALIWASLLALFLMAISESQTAQEILVTTVAVVAAIRIVAYYREDISIDLAKMLPLALLGIVLVNPGAVSEQTIMQRGNEALSISGQFLPFFAGLIVLEWLLRISLSIKRRIFGGGPNHEETLEDLARRKLHLEKKRIKKA